MMLGLLPRNLTGSLIPSFGPPVAFLIPLMIDELEFSDFAKLAFNLTPYCLLLPPSTSEYSYITPIPPGNSSNHPSVSSATFGVTPHLFPNVILCVLSAGQLILQF